MARNDEWTPDWVVHRPGFVGIPNSDKDELHNRIGMSLAATRKWGRAGRTITPFVDSPIRVHEIIANAENGPHSSRLWILDAENGLVLLTVGSEDAVQEAEVALWTEIVSNAMSRLGQREPVMWRAHLAQSPGLVPYGKARLDSSLILTDEVTLAPAAGIMTTDAIAVVGQVMAGPDFSGVIQVDGETPCYSWHADGETATLRRLRLLTAEVSLVWRQPWFLRDGPTDTPDARWDGAAGPLSGHHYGWNVDLDDSIGVPAALLPDWFAEMDERFAELAVEKSPVYRALLMHHEGQLVMAHHASLALLSFVASIETLAAVDEHLQRCETCGVVRGSTARFRQAVAKVLTDDEAQYLAKAYDQRSRTVHDSLLHGRELYAGGWGRMSLYDPDEVMTFDFGTVRMAESASRALIWQHLGLEGTLSDFPDWVQSP